MKVLKRGADKLDFPKIMVNNTGLTILFFTPGIGTVLALGNSVWEVGYIGYDFDMDLFHDYTGTITLENS